MLALDIWKFITEIHFGGFVLVCFRFANYFPLLETLNIVITELPRQTLISSFSNLFVTATS